ncbi:hypothetical protein DTO027I6_2737 [Penicillium roqueforti]|nr:hypothetical protein CBS147355_5412 [Penicillium roqueforti]KAI2688518.1 hypothetical protein LCP963914a_2920 [Penicillium roqueforti]KAI3217511.1 hypothetical protein DTO027I6_2737 [Penicillium roqueforti]
MLSQVHSHRVLDNRITQSLLALRNRDHPQGKHRSHRDRVHVLDRHLQCTRNGVHHVRHCQKLPQSVFLEQNQPEDPLAGNTPPSDWQIFQQSRL